MEQPRPISTIRDHQPQTNILVVDDNPNNLRALAAILEPLGQNLVQVQSGDAALRELLHRDFAVLLLDVALPSMDGYEIARLVRGREQSRQMPIIFVTAHETPPDQVVAAYTLGAVDFLVKPLVPAILRSKVAVFVDLFQKTEQVKWQQELLLRQQQEMLRAEQLAAVGQLGASVAHEVRNPLTTIKLLVEAALRPRDPRALDREQLRVIHHEIERLEQTVQEFLDFARPPRLQRRKGDFRSLVRQATDLIQARAGQQGVSLTVRLPPQAVLMQVDHDQVRTVLVNLLLNALDAMPRGGDLVVGLKAEPKTLHLTVADTGVGIPPDLRDRLFTPFLSTKPTGTGLGLCIGRRIAEEHGGWLHLDNRPDGGVCATLSLPLLAEDG
jgi:signal transduction histidine kinase